MASRYLRPIAIIFAMLQVCSQSELAHAQGQALREMYHAMWTTSDGAPQVITELAQHPDGTLWIGSESGLFNFDGPTFSRFRSPPGEPELPSGQVYAHQTRSFAAAIAGLAVLVVAIVYRLRVQQISRVMAARFDERLAERTRVARELHDTLLQTVHGSKLVADRALRNTTDRDGLVRALEQLSVWLGQASVEGRAALQSLRASTTESNDLAAAFRRAIDECRHDSSAEMPFSVQGRARELHPIVRDEVYRVGYEAIRNACVHAQASRIIVALEYGRDLTLRISDNGVGIDGAVAEGEKESHFGLRGMRERADRIGARFSLISGPGAGTAITLIVPGRNFAQPESAHHS